MKSKKIMFSKNKNKGFTLIEILISLAVLGIVFSITVGTFYVLSKKQILSQSAETVLSSINSARMNALSSKGGQNYGVHMESDKIVVFPGTSYVINNPLNIEKKLDSSVILNSWSLNGGGSDIVFDKLSGETMQFGSAVLSSKRDSSLSKTITINPSGISEISN